MKPLIAFALASLLLPVSAAAEGKPRARDLCIEPGILQPGELNAITDVNGVRVGHVTVRDGNRINTGLSERVGEITAKVGIGKISCLR